MKRISTPGLLLFGSIFCTTIAQNNLTTGEDGFTFQASYIGDNVNNLAGGVRRGSCYLGLANFRINFNTKDAGLWNGGEFYINAANTHGASPSSELIGDLQVSSNIEAGNHTFLQELWYKQTLGKTELTIGLQDLNAQFANTENGSLFLNSSFGILPTISGNIPAPVYPLTSFGFSVKWMVSEKITWSDAVYDGCPSDFDHNPYNLNWQFNSGDGILINSEIQYLTNLRDLPGTYKLGIYNHNHLFKKGKSQDIDSACTNNMGVYAIADQIIWKREKSSLGSFLQIGCGPVRLNKNYFYMGTGINYHLHSNKKRDDILGAAIALAWLNGNIDNETTLELTYKRQITKHIFLQPDIQYIINPAGLDTILGNSVAGTLRMGLLF
jgi:porin